LPLLNPLLLLLLLPLLLLPLLPPLLLLLPEVHPVPAGELGSSVRMGTWCGA